MKKTMYRMMFPINLIIWILLGIISKWRMGNKMKTDIQKIQEMCDRVEHCEDYPFSYSEFNT